MPLIATIDWFWLKTNKMSLKVVNYADHWGRRSNCEAKLQVRMRKWCLIRVFKIEQIDQEVNEADWARGQRVTPVPQVFCWIGANSKCWWRWCWPTWEIVSSIQTETRHCWAFEDTWGQSCGRLWLIHSAVAKKCWTFADIANTKS